MGCEATAGAGDVAQTQTQPQTQTPARFLSFLLCLLCLLNPALPRSRPHSFPPAKHPACRLSCRSSVRVASHCPATRQPSPSHARRVSQLPQRQHPEKPASRWAAVAMAGSQQQHIIDTIFTMKRRILRPDDCTRATHLPAAAAAPHH